MGYGALAVEKTKEAIRLISEGSTLKSACRQVSIHVGTFRDVVNESREVAELYQRAREMRADIDADDNIEIADDETIDPQRARNMIEARKWRASKQYAKVYGDKLDISSTQTISILDVRQEALKRVLDFRGQANEIFDAETVPETPELAMNEQSSENDIFS